MTLKGQNLRILTFGTTGFKCIGMAVNCTVTLTNNVEQAETKDDVGMSAKPTMVSQSWSVQVESLDVSDMAAMLTAVKSLTSFTLMWDETSTADNQTGEGATLQRIGHAYLNDATFEFNNRANSQKNLQFTGDGGLQHDIAGITYEEVTADTYTKGQFVRLFLGSDNTTTPAKVIGAAQNLSLHVSLQMEDSTTKDTTGNWLHNEPTGLSYDITTSALVRGSDNTTASSVQAQDFTSLESIYEAGTPVKWEIANVSGANQRTKGAVICSGSCLITQLTLNAANRQSANYQATLTGYGTYTVTAA